MHPMNDDIARYRRAELIEAAERHRRARPARPRQPRLPKARSAAARTLSAMARRLEPANAQAWQS